MPPRLRRRRSSSDDLHRKIREQKEKIITQFLSLDICNNLFNKWRYKKRQDAEARRGFKAWQARKDLKTKLNNRMLSKQDNNVGGTIISSSNTRQLNPWVGNVLVFNWSWSNIFALGCLEDLFGTSSDLETA